MFRYNIVALCHLPKDGIDYYYFFDTDERKLFCIDENSFLKKSDNKPDRQSKNYGLLLILVDYVFLILSKVLDFNFVVSFFILELLFLPLLFYMVLRNKQKEMGRIKENSTFLDPSVETLKKLYHRGKKERVVPYILIVIMFVALATSIYRYVVDKNVYFLFAVPGSMYIVFFLIMDCFPTNLYKLHRYIEETE